MPSTLTGTVEAMLPIEDVPSFLSVQFTDVATEGVAFPIEDQKLRWSFKREELPQGLKPGDRVRVDTDPQLAWCNKVEIV